MECIKNYFLKLKIKKIVNKFVNNNNFGLYFNLVTDIIKKELVIYIEQNMRKEDSECLICYENKKHFFNTNCCNNPNICIDCFNIMINSNKFNCVICRKNLIKNIILKIENRVNNSLHINEKLNRKFNKKKKILLNNINKSNFKVKLLNQLKKHNNEHLFNFYGFYFSDVKSVEMLDFYLYKIIWSINNNLVTSNLFIKNNVVYFQYGHELYIEFNNFF